MGETEIAEREREGVREKECEKARYGRFRRMKRREKLKMVANE